MADNGDRIKIEFEMDGNFNAFFKFQCPVCHQEHKLEVQGIIPGKQFECSCGFKISFSGDSLTELQKSLETMKSDFDVYYR